MLVGVLGLGFLTNIGIAVWFELEQDYIAQELCQEKDVVDSDCAGHCVLTKTVNDSKPVTSVVLESKPLLFLIPSVLTERCYCSENTWKTPVHVALLEQPPGKIFRPPC